MTSTNLDVLHWVQSRCGGQIYDKSQDARIRSGANKRFYQLVLAQRDAVVAFFSCIHPYVIIKKKHVELARAFLALPKYVRLHSPLKDLMYRQMKALNHRGGLNFQLELL
jgi:hypothetical protein